MDMYHATMLKWSITMIGRYVTTNDSVFYNRYYSGNLSGDSMAEAITVWLMIAFSVVGSNPARI